MPSRRRMRRSGRPARAVQNCRSRRCPVAAGLPPSRHDVDFADCQVFNRPMPLLMMDHVRSEFWQLPLFHGLHIHHLVSRLLKNGTPVRWRHSIQVGHGVVRPPFPCFSTVAQEIVVRQVLLEIGEVVLDVNDVGRNSPRAKLAAGRGENLTDFLRSDMLEYRCRTTEVYEVVLDFSIIRTDGSKIANPPALAQVVQRPCVHQSFPLLSHNGRIAFRVRSDRRDQRFKQRQALADLTEANVPKHIGRCDRLHAMKRHQQSNIQIPTRTDFESRSRCLSRLSC